MRVEAFGGPWDGAVMEVPEGNTVVRFTLMENSFVGPIDSDLEDGSTFGSDVEYPIVDLPDGRKVLVNPLYWPGENF